MSNEKKITFDITGGTFIGVFLVLLTAGVFYFNRAALTEIIIVILFSVIIASGVGPGARWFQKYKVPRILSVIFVYLVSFLVLGLIFYLIIPILFSELSVLSATLSSYLDQPIDSGIISELIPKLPESVVGILKDLTLKSEEYIQSLMSGFTGVVSKIFGGVFSLILVIIISFYLSVQEKGIENFLRTITPIKNEKYVVGLWLRSSRKIAKWLQGQIVLGLVVGVLVFIGLTILQVPYALVFAVLAALFEIIPIFGPILASIPPIVISFIQSPALGLMVIALYFLIQQFENHLIYPVVVSKIVGVPPIMTVLALFIGGKLLGFAGVILAVPIIAVLVEIIDDIEKKKGII